MILEFALPVFIVRVWLTCVAVSKLPLASNGELGIVAIVYSVLVSGILVLTVPPAVTTAKVPLLKLTPVGIVLGKV